MELPRPYWADHDHSDEHLNLMFRFNPPRSDPGHPYSSSNSHSDSRLNIIYTTVHQQRSHSLPTPPSLSPDSGNSSPSDPAPRAKLHAINTAANPATLTPPLTPPLFAEARSQNLPLYRAHAWSLSSGWDASDEESDSSTSHLLADKKPDNNDKNDNSNILTRSFKRARECIRTASKKISPMNSGAENFSNIGNGGRGLFGAVEEADANRMSRNGGSDKSSKCAKVIQGIKKVVLCKSKREPVHLTQAKVRMALDE